MNEEEEFDIEFDKIHELFDPAYVNVSVSKLMNAVGLSHNNVIEINQAYWAPSRHYHNMAHIREMLDFIRKNFQVKYMFQEELAALAIAIIYHDAVYDPMRKDNEELSAKMAVDAMKASGSQMLAKLAPEVHKLIMLTKNHEYDSDHKIPKSYSMIILADLDRFCTQDFKTLWNYNIQLFKEYAPVDWKDYGRGRVEFLEQYKEKIKSFMPARAYENIGKLQAAYSMWTPRIAVYAGSFDPFHLGHMDILDKASNIFDKVIVVQAVNPEKAPSKYKFPEWFKKCYQVETFSGSLMDYISTKPYPVTVVRGLRNTTDMQYELNQYRWYQEFDPKVSLVSIICDRDNEHLSSSALRVVENLDPRLYKKKVIN